MKFFLIFHSPLLFEILVVYFLHKKEKVKGYWTKKVIFLFFIVWFHFYVGEKGCIGDHQLLLPFVVVNYFWWLSNSYHCCYLSRQTTTFTCQKHTTTLLCFIMHLLMKRGGYTHCLLQKKSSAAAFQELVDYCCLLKAHYYCLSKLYDILPKANRLLMLLLVIDCGCVCEGMKSNIDVTFH